MDRLPALFFRFRKFQKGAGRPIIFCGRYFFEVRIQLKGAVFFLPPGFLFPKVGILPHTEVQYLEKHVERVFVRVALVQQHFRPMMAARLLNALFEIRPHAGVERGGTDDGRLPPAEQLRQTFFVPAYIQHQLPEGLSFQIQGVFLFEFFQHFKTRFHVLSSLKCGSAGRGLCRRFRSFIIHLFSGEGKRGSGAAAHLPPVRRVFCGVFRDPVCDPPRGLSCGG